VCLEGRHRYHVWLNGHSVGTVTSAADSPGPGGGGLGVLPSVHQEVHLPFPAGAVGAGVNVLAVLTDDWGHNEDFPADNLAKQPRGLWSAALDRGGGARCGFAPGGENGVHHGQRGTTQPPTAAPDGGESRVETLRRFARAFRVVLARPEPHVLVVAHGLLLRAATDEHPQPEVTGVPYGSFVRLARAELEDAAHRLERWCEAPSW
jgi:hypothetical protein